MEVSVQIVKDKWFVVGVKKTTCIFYFLMYMKKIKYIKFMKMMEYYIERDVRKVTLKTNFIISVAYLSL